MASRFRILESLSGTRTSGAPASWRERALSVVPASDVAYEATAPGADGVEPIASPTGTHPLLPFSLDAIEPPRPRTGGLAALDPLGAGSRTTARPPLGGTGSLSGDSPVRHTGYLTGISLSGILQMLHMERNSCLLEVTAGGRLGTLTMVNGELIDAEVGDDHGDATAMRILRWPSPVTSILPSASLVRHSVNMPLTQLLMDAVRLQDEDVLSPEAVEPADAVATRPDPRIPARWCELPALLVELGADVAEVTTAADDEPAARAGVDEGRLAASAAVARGVRTWSSLLVDGVDRVHVIAGGRRLVLASLSPDDAAFVYLEAPAELPLGAIWQAIADAS